MGALTDESLWTATLLGLASIPFTVALSWGTVVRSWGLAPGETAYLGGTISGVPIIVAGLAAGYLYGDRPTASRTAGVRTGLVGSLPIVLSHLSNSTALLWAGSLEVAVLAVVATPLVAVVGGAICGLVGMIAAALGEWIAGR